MIEETSDPLKSSSRRASANVYSFLRAHVTILVLILLLGASLGMRLYGLHWDNGNLIHPDERAILWENMESGSGKRGVSEIGMPNSLAEFFSVKSPLNTHWFPYGSFPIYLLKGVSLIPNPFFDDYSLDDYAVLGRGLNAFVDTASILLVFLIGSRLYSRRVGLLATAFITFAVLHIQYSHFYTPDVLLTFFALLTIYLLAGIMRKPGWIAAAFTGSALGLGLATKVSFAPIFVAVFAAYFLSAISFEKGKTSVDTSHLMHTLFFLFITLVMSGTAFVVAQPYAIIDWHTFLGDFREQSEMVRRIRDYPYTRQYEGTTPYWYHISQFAIWSVGPFLGILSWLGLIFSAAAGALRKNKADILILAWALPYFLVIGQFDVKFLRYLLPITPFLILLASRLIFSAYDWLKARQWVGWKLANPHIATAVGVITLIATALYAVPFMKIYTEPHSAVAAAQWFRENVPANSVATHEIWDENIPGMAGGSRYQVLPMDNYGDDNEAKRDRVIGEIMRADYITMYSNRLYGVIPLLPERYPFTSQYYARLFDGPLGFELVYQRQNNPGLFGITIGSDTFKKPGLTAPKGYDRPTVNLGFADESFTVYDRPLVLIFKKTSALTREQLETVLPSSSIEQRPLQLMLNTDDLKAQEEGGTFSEIFNRDSIVNKFPEFFWLLGVEFACLVCLPIGLTVFSRLPDKGYLLTKMLALLLLSFIVFTVSSIHLLPFTRGTIWLTLAFLAAVSAAIAWKNQSHFRKLLKENWQRFLFFEAIFLVAMFTFYMVRLADPDLWDPYLGGEKPMDFAYLNAVIKSTYMPAYDPWFAGGFLNYYYFGQFHVATVIKWLGILPSVSYNLAVATWFALMAGGVFSVGYNLASLTLGGNQPAQRNWKGFLLVSLAGFMAVLFVLVLGNLDGVIQVIRNRIDDLPLSHFDFWGSTRAIHSDPPGYEITEFPYFTFLFGDLHAHMISLPITALTLGLCLNLIASARAASMRSRMVTIFFIGLAMGALRATNSWDSVTYLLVVVLSIGIAEFLRTPQQIWRVLGRSLLISILVFLISYMLFLPFNQKFENFYASIHHSEWRTPVKDYFVIHGLFIFTFVIFIVSMIALRYIAPIRTRLRSWGLRNTAHSLLDDLKPKTLAKATVGFVLLLSLGSIAYFGYKGYSTAILLSAIIFVICIAFLAEAHTNDEDKGVRLFVYVMLAVALALGVGVEVVVLDGDINRLNTVFKVYLQAWVLFGIVSAFAVWSLLFAPGVSLLKQPWAKAAFAVPLTLLILSAGVYTVMGGRMRLANRFDTTVGLNRDGMAYMDTATYDDGQSGRMTLISDKLGIIWLQDNVKGSPVVLEAVPQERSEYKWYSRVSIYTGLPGLIGWNWHQTQQRAASGDVSGRPEIARTVDEMRTRQREGAQIYQTDDKQLSMRLIQKYRIKYVYIGQLEISQYSNGGLAKFDEMTSLRLVYSNPGLKIYQVVDSSR
ncbi:MAG: phospholipid carrier-dependent glycosyltransferase [Dehalococcoidia bacterium]|nr:phospholipid carrier-dependent glycosyltransferase [Dehalococcoidia bacterium]